MLPNVAFCSGLVFVGFLASAIFLWQKAHRYARALKASEETNLKNIRILKSILSSMEEGVIVVDALGDFIMFNHAAEAILGRSALKFPPSEWPSKYGFFLPDKTTPCPSGEIPLFRAMRGEEVEDMEFFIRNSSKPTGMWLSMSAKPLKEVDGVTRGGVLLFRDITDEKRLQEQNRLS